MPSPKPAFVSLTLNQIQNLETEIIAWPDGSISVPIRSLAQYFNIGVNLSPRFKTLFFARSPNRNQTALNGSINWETQRIEWNNQPVLPGKHPILEVSQSTIVEEDAYVDSRVAEKLLHASITYNPEETVLTVQTREPLNKNALGTLSSQPSEETPYSLEQDWVRVEPEVLHAGIEKIKVIQTTQTQAQQINQPLDLNGTLFNTGHQFMVSRTLTDIQGTFLGQPYHLQPSFLAYNRKLNLETLEGSLTHRGKHYETALGSLNVGQSPLVSPALKIWGLTVSSLHPATFNASSHAADRTMLPAGQSSYSGFIGRNPIQFYPVLPGQPGRLLLPQSQKGLLGGNYLLGLTPRLTMGTAFAADQVAGQPKTFTPLRFPLSADLSGFNSYLRDPNYFSGATLGFSAAYRLSDHWQFASDLGFSRYRLKPGSGLPIPASGSGKALKAGLSYHRGTFNSHMELFRYDPGYYCPETSRYGLPLYDRQGVSLGVNGALPKPVGFNYALQWEHAQTNRGHFIPGGLIQADHYTSTLSRQLGQKLSLNWNFNIINGNNQQRKSILKSHDITLKTVFPHQITGELRVSRYFTNALYFPGKDQRLVLLKNSYTNNGVDASVDIPLSATLDTHIKLGNQWSSFVNYGYFKARFRYKNFFWEPYLQKSYGNTPQLQNKIGCKLGYEWPNGATVSMAYSRTLNVFNSPQSFFPGINIHTHEVYFEFSQVFGFIQHRLQALGPRAESTATLTGQVFMDYDRNQKYTPLLEHGMSHIQLRLDQNRLITTDTHGKYSALGLEPGEHTLELVADGLPITVEADARVYQFTVSGGKTLRWDIPLPYEGLTLKGQLGIRSLDSPESKQISPDLKGMVLILKNASGKIVNYTSTDSRGAYQFSSLPLGVYKVGLEPQIETQGQYQLLNTPPPVFANAAPLNTTEPVVLHLPEIQLLKLF